MKKLVLLVSIVLAAQFALAASTNKTTQNSKETTTKNSSQQGRDSNKACMLELDGSNAADVKKNCQKKR